MSPMNRRQLLHALLGGGLGLTLVGRFPMPGVASGGPLWTPGTLPDPSKPEGTDLLPQIEHIVVLVMENHSFDNYFGLLGRGDGLTIGFDGLPVNSNPDEFGDPVRIVSPPSTDQAGFNVRLGWNNVFRQAHAGAMDGFVTSSGLEAMTYFTEGHLPFYYSLALQFPVCDRYFCSVPGATYPNRRFLTAATCAGITGTSIDAIVDNPSAPNGTIYDRLDALSVPWFNYSAGLPEVALWPDYYFANPGKVRPIDEFYTACQTDTLPGFSLVTPGLNLDEHPPQDIALGEQWSAGVINALLQSPAWERSVLIFTYDEHGGFYDHVPPPAALPPGDGILPIFDGVIDPGAEDYDRYGMRVPALVISPFSRRDYVSHVVHDHTSILRLIETKWNIGSITNRDANASNLLDSLDLDGDPPFVEPPETEEPTLGFPVITPDPAAVAPGADQLVPHPDPATPVRAVPDLTG